MKGFILLALASFGYANSIDQSDTFSAYGYIEKVLIPLGEKIRKAEEAYLSQGADGSRIAGGSFAELGQFPYQAGVLTSYANVAGTGVCGGSLVSASVVVHAAHCWWDGRFQGISSEIVLGSTTIFFGGTRTTTRDVTMHPEWNINIIRNDVAVIRLPNPVPLTNNISPIALPVGPLQNEDFAGETGVASGFGRTGDGINNEISISQVLSYVELNILSNSACTLFFPGSVVSSNICTSGFGGTSTCRGDSGGPLVTIRDGRPILVGITSFGSVLGCEVGFPAAFARVTSFLDFFNQFL